ncbi:uncharacterized protein LOC134614914 [Pelobates fuscus]|uniref:uncharacterized protein LOC134614914 n=1 Tax=Pelobates fuscus TaxID=191477 RepID=UPI002FE4615D
MLQIIALTIINLSLITANCCEDGIIQTPKHIICKPGQSISITCSVESPEELEGVRFKKGEAVLLFIYKDNTNTSNLNYAGHLEFYGIVSNFTVTLNNVTQSDADVYYCEGLTSKKICGKGTVVTVDNCSEHSSSASFDPRLIALMFLVVISVLVHIILIIYQRRKCRNHVIRAPLNTVYEDMTQTIRRNTMGNNNCYANPRGITQDQGFWNIA